MNELLTVVVSEQLGLISKIEAKCCMNKLHVPHDDIDKILGEVLDVYVVVVHRPSGRQYTLDRAYRLNPECQSFKDDFLKMAVETWDGYTTLHQPEWSSGLPASEFFAYWMY